MGGFDADHESKEGRGTKAKALDRPGQGGGKDLQITIDIWVNGALICSCFITLRYVRVSVSINTELHHCYGCFYNGALE